ncbi:MAG: hypothetical protein AAF330_02775, partial [Pseudomonadota bacterium]
SKLISAFITKSPTCLEENSFPPSLSNWRTLADGAVEAVLPDWELPPLWLSLFYPPYEALPPLVATFSDFFEAYLKDLDGFEF